LDHLKEGIGLRGYGQRDPLVEYKKESFQLFESMKEAIEEQMLQYLFRFEIAQMQTEVPAREEEEKSDSAGSEAEQPVPVAAAARRAPDSGMRSRRTASHSDLSYQGAHDPTAGGDFSVQTVRSTGPKVGRNDPCTCGSGKKYKKCHGAKHGEQ
jgi:preprotein translocase subunit SecA